MDTFSYGSLRFPASLFAGFAITGALFWTLWSFTDKSFEVVEVVPIKIEFSRAVQDTPTEPRQREKVVLEEPLEVVTPPLIGDRVPDEIAVAVVRSDPLVPEIPSTGIPLGADREPLPVFRVQPIYPPRAAASNTEGWVLVQFDISSTGAVTNVTAVESEPGTTFDKAATDAVARWRYNPMVVNGKAVERVGVQTLLRFTLEGE